MDNQGKITVMQLINSFSLAAIRVKKELKELKASNILQVADYGGPYSGNFIASLLSLQKTIAEQLANGMQNRSIPLQYTGIGGGGS